MEWDDLVEMVFAQLCEESLKMKAHHDTVSTLEGMSLFLKPKK